MNTIDQPPPPNSGVEGTQPPEFTGIASPILDPEGNPVAAISCRLGAPK